MASRSRGRVVPKAPAYTELPAAKRRATRGGPELRELSVRLEVVTPILGGSYQTRTIDAVDVIRAPSVRGHLRFWWRALYASQYASAEELFQRESALWGRAATNDRGRSAVEIRVRIEGNGGAIDHDDINPQKTPGAYALWPAREPPAPRRTPGTRFQLTLTISGTAQDESEVKNALRAWIVFGGYGSRTRRGLGSFKVLDTAQHWLPTAATRVAFAKLFDSDIFAAPTRPPGDVPLLGGADLHIGRVSPRAEQAWTTALDWLKDFRQGTNGDPGNRAREPGTGKAGQNRPSISNWPEADKIRRIENKTRSHRPRHNEHVVWPRAGFGLPIVGRFQTTDRYRNKNAYDEPGDFEIRWRSPKPGRPHEFEEHDRLASPLIVKALPIVNGRGTVEFVPCALWLHRGYPTGGQVGLARPKRGQPGPKEIDPDTTTSFDSPLVARDDTARFAALANKSSLREAFLDWLRATHKTTVVAP